MNFLDVEQNLDYEMIKYCCLDLKTKFSAKWLIILKNLEYKLCVILISRNDSHWYGTISPILIFPVMMSIRMEISFEFQ